jgi:hypothetical protein
VTCDFGLWRGEERRGEERAEVRLAPSSSSIGTADFGEERRGEGIALLSM